MIDPDPMVVLVVTRGTVHVWDCDLTHVTGDPQWTPTDAGLGDRGCPVCLPCRPDGVEYPSAAVASNAAQLHHLAAPDCLSTVLVWPCPSGEHWHAEHDGPAACAAGDRLPRKEHRGTPPPHPPRTPGRHRTRRTSFRRS